MSTALANSFLKIEGRLDRDFLCQRREAEVLDRPLEIGAQMWACCECGTLRQWGFLQPADRRMKPALDCEQDGAMTRHAFVAIFGRLTNPNDYRR